MRISDWSSDVCSSDLVPPHRAAVPSFRAVSESSDRTARPHRPGRCCPGTFHWAPAPVRRPPHPHRAPTPRVALPAGKGARPGSTATCLGDADRRAAKLRKAESQPRTDLVDRREIIRPALGEIEAVAFARLGQKGDVRCAVLDQGDMIGHAGARILVEKALLPAPDCQTLATLLPPASPDWIAPTSPSLRSEEHTSELQSLMRISYAVFCLKKKKTILHLHTQN